MLLFAQLGVSLECLSLGKRRIVELSVGIDSSSEIIEPCTYSVPPFVLLYYCTSIFDPSCIQIVVVDIVHYCVVVVVVTQGTHIPAVGDPQQPPPASSRLWGIRHTFCLQGFKEAFLALGSSGAGEGRRGGNHGEEREGSSPGVARPVLTMLMADETEQLRQALARLPAALQWVSLFGTRCRLLSVTFLLASLGNVSQTSVWRHTWHWHM